MRRTLVLTAFAFSCLAAAQKDMIGRDQFPQFRNLGGLAGNMVPLNPDGSPNYFGALSLSTPVAYTLSNWHGSVGYGLMSFDMTLRAPGKDNQRNTNGTAQFMLGAPSGPYGQFMATYMILSHLGDGAFNFQLTPGRQAGKVRWAVGLQDLRGNGGSAGENIAGDSESSTSFYSVTTYAINEKTHLSLGTGTRRFKGVFGNISTNITDNLKATLEYDAFNWNFGVAYKLGSIMKLQGEGYDTPGRSVDAHTFLGVVRGKSLFWGVGISF